MTLKKRTVISFVIFAVLFAAMLVTATFTDLQVSRILTKGTLPEGQFLATGLFGVIFECMGCVAPFLIGTFALEILLVYTIRFFTNKWGRIALAAVIITATTAAYYALMQDILVYNLRHYHVDTNPAFMKGESILVAAFLTFVCTMAVNNFSDESIKKLIRVTFAVGVAIALSTISVELLKLPFGRPRFRAMNYAGDFSYFTRWYVLSGQPDKEWMISTFSSADACKSFPSGHTSSAAVSFCLVMLKDALNIESKAKKALLWCAPILWTGTVALSRIMVGAHFFSDVLIGGTIGFLSVMLAREIFVCRFSHIKSLKG